MINYENEFKKYLKYVLPKKYNFNEIYSCKPVTDQYPSILEYPDALLNGHDKNLTHLVSVNKELILNQFALGVPYNLYFIENNNFIFYESLAMKKNLDIEEWETLVSKKLDYIDIILANRLDIPYVVHLYLLNQPRNERLPNKFKEIKRLANKWVEKWGR